VQLRPALVGPAADLAMQQRPVPEAIAVRFAASCVCIQNSICLIAIGALGQKDIICSKANFPGEWMFVCAYKRTVQGRVQISPVAHYRSKRPLAPRGRASGRKYWAGGPSAGPDFTSSTKPTDARSFDYCFRGIVCFGWNLSLR